MRTEFSAELLATDAGARANEILRACVHCGFCNATCPTYLVSGDELDGPRGRIYLMKSLLEEGVVSDRSVEHLDRCLTCRACETTCPSGVAYGELAEIARAQIGPGRSGMSGVLRRLLKWMVPRPGRLRAMARLGKLFRPLVPGAMVHSLPRRIGRGVISNRGFTRQVVVLNGCAQQVSTAETNVHLQNLLAEHGVGTLVVDGERCCGALDLHLGDEAAALRAARANVDALHAVLGDVEAVISSASGCGVTYKDYARLLQGDPDYAQKAAEVAARVLDVSEYLAEFKLQAASAATRVAWHAPCTLQHGQQLRGGVESLLSRAGYELVDVVDAHLCCGSAGSYSMLQPEMSAVLKQRKLGALQHDAPDVIATANVGCQTHLASGSQVPVVHWIELVK